VPIESEVVVAEIVEIPAKLLVDEAKRPLVKLIIVEVEFTPTPKLVPGVNGNAKIFAEVR
jgi:hypothetical protein